MGTGLALFFSEDFSVDLQGLYQHAFTDRLDGLIKGNSNDGYVTASLKVTLYLGGNRDSDGDGIFDSDDLCPKLAEDFDGFQDEDGCPEPDNDKDGIMDKVDKCPNNAEDIDGFKDKDGCPDPDNDNDGIPDISDKCPNDPETINGWEDQDGCPDKVPPVKFEKEKPMVLKGVFFKTGNAELDPNSESILDDVVITLKDNKQIELEIHGHTVNTGGADRNRKLSAERAQAVKNYLVKKGIKESRLMVRGLGPDKPIASNETKEGRARNRRIEFIRIK